jgi:DNA-directed RNA polymerase
MQEAFEPTRAEIERWFKEMDEAKAGRKFGVYQLLKDFAPDILTFLTMKVVFENISDTRNSRKYSKTCIELGRLLEDERNFQIFKDSNKALFKKISQDLNQRTANYGQKRTVLRHSAKKDMIELVKFSEQDKMVIGAALIEVFKRTTGYIDVVRQVKGKKDTGHIIAPTELTMSWIKQKNARCEVLSPVVMPCVIPPKPWTSPTDGGFYSGMFRVPFVKTRNMNYLQELANVDMWEVYQAINHMQNTAWSINQKVFDVIKLADTSGQGWANLPTGEGKALPPKPEDIDTNEEARRDWKRKATAIYNENVRNYSKYISLQKKLQVAEKFKDEPQLYYVYNLDFRGRAYPVQMHLTPQGDDVCKGLLQFSEGKVLDDDGANWLAIHGANSYGYDKDDFDGRIDWVEKHQDSIIASALRPFEETFWTKADKPWAFLAFCVEWKGYLEDPENFKSHIPIAMDGSCNGLQNFSAMLRDPIGGKATNLIPADKPQDIYQRVADVVNDLITEDMAKGVQEAFLWKGFVNRKLAKRPTMTMPYGATLIGMKEQIMQEVQDWKDKGLPHPQVSHKDCLYMATIIKAALATVVVAAAQAMEWLQKVAKVAAEENLPIRWYTPVGFPVLQDYRVPLIKRVDTLVYGGLRVRQQVSVGYTAKIAKRNMEQGISPNFVHSVDASHMIRTAALSLENGIGSIAMIHDSFGTHAADAAKLFAIIRHAFVQIHEEVDILANFEEQLRDQIREELHAKLPKRPKKGSLDLTLVHGSSYFFA